MDANASVPEYCLKPRLILGCGNRLLGDDGFGPAVIDRLVEEYEIPDDVCALDAGTGVRNILFTLCLSEIRPREILLIDAVDDRREPGEVFETAAEDLPQGKADDFFLHQAPTSNLVKGLLSRGVRITILGCQPTPTPESVVQGLSPTVIGGVEQACKRIALSHHCSRNPIVAMVP